MGAAGAQPERSGSQTVLPGAGERPQGNGGQGDRGIPECAKRARICRESPLQERGAVRHSSRTAQRSVRQDTAGERGLRVERSTAVECRRKGMDLQDVADRRCCIPVMSAAAISDRAARSRFRQRGRESGRRANLPVRRPSRLRYGSVRTAPVAAPRGAHLDAARRRRSRAARSMHHPGLQRSRRAECPHVAWRRPHRCARILHA